MTNINTDALAEAYTAISNIQQKVFYDAESSQDTYDFLKAIATQINVYRVAVVKNQK
jgi:hypothetical protein